MKACKGKTKPGKVSPAVFRGKAGRKPVSRGKAGSPTWAGKFPAARVGRLGRKGGTSPA